MTQNRHTIHTKDTRSITTDNLVWLCGNDRLADGVRNENKVYESISVVISNRHDQGSQTNAKRISADSHKHLVKIKTENLSQKLTKCCLINARSARNKANEIHEYISNEQIQIAAITETWLTVDDK